MINDWKSGMMGLIVGDALGVPVQFMEREEIRNRPEGLVTGMEAGGVYQMPKGTWSDDSSMALATLVSLQECNGINLDDIMKNFCDWELNGNFTPFGEAFDQGNTCTEAIYRYIETKDVKTCGKTGERANGNGALMRILPVCLYLYEKAKKVCTSQDEAIYQVHAVASLTHNHLRSNMCCGFYYYMVKAILDGKENGNTLLDLLQKGVDDATGFYGKDLRNLTEMARLYRFMHLSAFQETKEKDIASSGYVLDTIEAAVWCLITTTSYKDCMLKAVNLGDDTDTVAAIAGGLAGLYYGYENIPEEWLGHIKRREWIEDLIARG